MSWKEVWDIAPWWLQAILALWSGVLLALPFLLVAELPKIAKDTAAMRKSLEEIEKSLQTIRSSAVGTERLLGRAVKKRWGSAIDSLERFDR
jgi:hypothetical protein